jgi:hypothetical protein
MLFAPHWAGPRMRTILAALLLSAILASGCSGGDGGKDGDSGASVSTTRTSTAAGTGSTGSNGTGTSGTPASDPAPNATLPANVTSFAWTGEGNGSRAFEFGFFLGTETACEDDWTIDAPAGQGSPGAFIRDDDGTTSAATGVHANGETTRTVEPSTYGGSGSQPLTSGARSYRFFIEAGSPSATDTWSASLVFRCEAAFNVTVAKVAPLWSVFDVLEMESSFTSATPLGATSVADGTITIQVGADATAWLWVGGASQGEWGVTSPAGSSAHAIGPSNTLQTVDGPAGAWTVTLDVNAAYGSGVWGTVAGPFTDFIPE